MPEETNPAAPGTDQQPPETDASEIDWKAKAAEWEKRAKGNFERIKELEPKAKQFDALEQASKSELERAQEQLAALQREADAAQADAIRYRVAAEHGISTDNLDLLGSGTEEEITARALKLASLAASQQPTTRAPAPDRSQGSSAKAAPADPAQQFASILRGQIGS